MNGIAGIGGYLLACILAVLHDRQHHCGKFVSWFLLTLTVYIIDAWIVGSISATIVATQAWMSSGMKGLPNYFWFRHFFYNPFRAGLDIILGRLPPSVFAVWLHANIFFLPLAIVLLVLARRLAAQHGLLKFSSDPSRGTASWMGQPDVGNVLRTGIGGGIIFGRDISTRKVLCMPRPEENNRLNSHVSVFGSSGSMKSRAYIMNAILQATLMKASVIVTDSKGMLYNKCARYLESEGYTIKVFNTASMLNSDRWNMLGEVKSDLDASLLTNIVIANTALPGCSGGKSDVFWVQGEMSLIKAIALYCVTEIPKERQNMGFFYSMITTGKPTYLDGLFAAAKPDSPARLSYNIFLQAPDGVRDGIISGMANRLQIFQNEMVRAFTATSDIDLTLPGQQKCAYFCIMPDYHSAYDYLSSLFFSFLFIRLIELADKSPGQKLPIPCFFLLDEFPNMAGISDFKKKLATIRSRNMHASIVFQDISQLEDRYPNKGWTGIIGNCDWRLFLGANDPDTAMFVETLLGKGTVTTQSISRYAGSKGWLDWGSETTRPESRNLMNLDEVLRLPVDEAVLFVRGQKPLRIKKMDYLQHPLAGKLVDSNINDYLPTWAREMRDGFQLDRTETERACNPAATIPAAYPSGQSEQPRRHSDKKNWGKKPFAGGKDGGNSDEPFFPKPAS
jgi:type IV secretion system protein VirD4